MKRITVEAQTPLEKHVKAWINRTAQDYNGSGVRGVIEDLFQGGCQSGMVSHLIYYHDTLKFYRRYRSYIGDLLSDAIENTGGGPSEVFGEKWDNTDPLASETQNQNLLAWFGFEETARILASRAGLEI